jgi:predicted nucleic acid-binding protein
VTELRSGVQVFIDTGAWIALALSRDPLHGRARQIWSSVLRSGALKRTSVPVVLETFTFLQRNTTQEVALGWKDSLAELSRFRVLDCTRNDVDRAWTAFERRDFHKLSAVDATSFVIMKKSRIRIAFAFDHHFAQAGFRML